jgi:hypothetical protein
MPVFQAFVNSRQIRMSRQVIPGRSSVYHGRLVTVMIFTQTRGRARGMAQKAVGHSSRMRRRRFRSTAIREMFPQLVSSPGMMK